MSELELKKTEESSGRVSVGIKTIALVITTIISLGSLTLNFVQWRSNAEDDLKEWRYEVSTFIIQHYDSIFGEDEEKRQAIRDVMLITFPEDITTAVYERLAKAAKSRQEMITWSEGLRQAEHNMVNSIISPDKKKITLYIQYYNSMDSGTVDYLSSVLKEKGYIVPDKDLVNQKIGPEIRYFYEEDKEGAEKLRDEVIKTFQEKNIDSDIKVRYMEDISPKPIKGVIELWM